MLDGIDLGAIRVLVVEDDSDARQIIKLALEECGALVETSTSPREALEQTKTTSYDMIVSDLSMPEMNGYDFVRELRARGVRTPAVAVTAYSRSEYKSLAFQAGFNMQLAKPLDLRELLTAVTHLTKHAAPEDGIQPPGALP